MLELDDISNNKETSVGKGRDTTADVSSSTWSMA